MKEGSRKTGVNKKIGCKYKDIKWVFKVVGKGWQKSSISKWEIYVKIKKIEQ